MMALALRKCPITVFEVARLRRAWLTAIASMVLVNEIVTVLSLRVHYTMDVFTGIVTDVFTGIVTALLVCGISSRVAPKIDRLISGRADISKATVIL
jgi:hypothetical protein